VFLEIKLNFGYRLTRMVLWYFK